MKKATINYIYLPTILNINVLIKAQNTIFQNENFFISLLLLFYFKQCFLWFNTLIRMRFYQITAQLIQILCIFINDQSLDRKI